MNIITEKYCNKCGKIKSIDQFFRGKGCKDDYRPECKLCYKASYLPLVKERKPAAGRLTQTIFTHSNRARINGNNGKIIYQEWRDLKEKYNNACLCCGRRAPEVEITLDHVLPLSMGGSNTIDNAQPLCLSCNSRKGTKHIDYR